MSDIILNYKILNKIGEGGMSRVFLGEDVYTKQKVAIKELLPQLSHSEDLRSRFRREAQIMASLDHPNIVRLLRYEESEKGFYLVMEFVEGLNLEQHISQITGPISEPKTIEIMSSILDAFEYAHSKNIVHRDIKPSNIIVQQNGKIKILDFGIAKILDENNNNKTSTGTRMGTVVYMSPEQVKATKDINHLSDIYSLGILLFQMITGKPPYDSGKISDFDIQTQIVKEILPRANEFYPFVSDRIQKSIDIATAKDPNKRFKNCSEFKESLISPVEKKQIDTAENNKTIPISENQPTLIQPGINTEVRPDTSVKVEIIKQPDKKSHNYILIILFVVIGAILITTIASRLNSDPSRAIENTDSIRIADSIAAAEAIADSAAIADSINMSSAASNNNSYASAAADTIEAIKEDKPAAKIIDVTVDHNISDNDEKGMLIHIKFKISNMQGKQGEVAVWFYYENGDDLTDLNNEYESNGHVAAIKYFTPSYSESIYQDFKVFMPNKELHVSAQGKTDLKFLVGIVNNGDLIASNNYIKFSITNN
jgi:serine/threonine protein kinase